ncbi:DUF5367 family protein [Ekhidna sp. To15]|uniref:DUF5367 family protein n=1 Tax=Ekhidna sp. To15 TaxID=3395267 RepID=UPI003F51B5E3
MKNKLKSILYASLTWFLGVCIYLGSFTISIMDDPELQANIALAVGIVPIASLSTYLFYRKDSMAPFGLAVTFIATAIVLDAAITVPAFIIPAGGSYLGFFGSLSFYLIAFEFFLTVFLFGQFLKHKLSNL